MNLVKIDFVKQLIRLVILTGSLYCVCIAPAIPAEETMILNMRNADIRALIQWVADFTGRNIIVHKDVQGLVTVVSKKPLNREEAYKVFLSTLNVHGFSAIDTGDAIKIVPLTLAKTSATTLDSGIGAEQVTAVIKLTNVPAQQLATSLQPLVSSFGYIAGDGESNTIIISDTSENVARIRQMVARMDREGTFEFELIPLQHANPQDILNSVKQLLGENEQGFQLVNLAIDDRSNSILVSGDLQIRARIRELVRQLDQEVKGPGSTQVIYLHYVDAAEMLGILKGIAEGLESNLKEKKSKISIEASASTNALVINAPPAIIQRMQKIVEQVDIRRAQIMVESLVVEVTDEVANSLGVSWVHTDAENFGEDGTGVAVNTLDRLSSGLITEDVLDGDGDVIGTTTKIIPERGLSLGYFENGNLQAIIRTLSANTNANILSTPTVIALDNEKASLLVGQSVPFRTGESTGAASSTTDPFVTIERHDIGISLDVTPRINQGDSVTLEIEQVTESIADSLETASDIITNKRSIKTKAMIKDDQMLVLGGLIREQDSKTEDKIPFLGSLPLIGRLFSGSGKSVSRVNLMVFIHPIILKNDMQIENLTKERYNFIRGKQLAYGSKEPKKLHSPLLPEFILYSPKK